ncbi:MAG: Gfo/Idh/MocA family oxidoreductase [Rubrivivax sp.]|nr:Gfo/Idh/MocA family oxidoreductase [Rubrivivax sp.]
MSAILNVGVIGLGVMGQRMLDRIKGHPRLNACLVWDADPAAIERTLQVHPHLHASAGAEQLIASAGLQSLYIATPPAAHLALSNAAFDAGLAVLCEKPLTVDFDAARRCIARIAEQDQRAAVNFSLASAPGLAALQDAFGAASSQPLGTLQAVEIELGFAAWPRPWQAAAGAWLSQRAEGGFAREVLSHFIFALQRVLGPVRVLASSVSYPEGGVGAETALQASLQAGAVAVQVRGRVDSDVPVPDQNRMLWRASEGEIELRDWFGATRQRRGDSAQSLGAAEALRASGQADQLEQWVHLIEGRQHGLPGFDEALAVQETIEALLKGR